MNDTVSATWATSLGLIEDVKAGDSAGWRRFVHLYSPLIYVWCRKAGLQEADAADLSQDVFQAVARGIKGLQTGGPTDSFRGWLWTITRHEIHRFFKRAAGEPSATGGTDAHAQLLRVPDWIDDEHVPELPGAESEVVRRAAELVRNDFEEQTWQAFWLSAVEGLTASEIGERLGMNANAVRQAKFRVLGRLKECVDFL